MRRPQIMILCCVGAAVSSGLAIGAEPIARPNTNDDGIRRSVQQRGFVPFEGGGREVPRGMGPAVFPDEFRTIDGSNNNLINIDWGAAGTQMMRMMSADYPLSDGSTPARMDGPSARAVSNAVNASPGDLPNSKGASDYLWQWGQFLDHDITEAPVGTDTMDIEVPIGDPWFDPMNTGTQVIGMHRSEYQIDDDGKRQQLNNITAFIDASNVYGSEDELAHWLRTNDGTGMLKTSAGDLLPFNTDGHHNAPTSDDPTLFLAGDVRSNEQSALTAIHTLFVREHNYWAQQLAVQFPDADGDELYERARAIVAAEMQVITFNEFLPLLLGADAMGPYGGYDDALEPMISNEFAAAAYRVGHTMLSPNIRRLEATKQTAAAGDLPLRNAFFTPANVLDHGIDGLLRGLAFQRAQEIDVYVVDDVRNMLFGPPGSGGFDLVSLNIQRGRDHGIPHYNALREMAGLDPVTSFAEISSDANVVSGLESVYADVDSIDPWVGLLAEDSAPDAMVGPTLVMILGDQFERLRSADRFWYESYLPADMIDLVEAQTLSKVIQRNTGIGAELSPTVFIAEPACPGDVNNDGKLDYFDVSAYIGLFSAQDPRADYADHDGVYDFFDVSTFLDEYNAGCP
ncbi:MAG: peroxidase family protein [Phycisphaerales bacterium]